ncbi:MAG: molybdopterin oxidoreductase family protein [Burkholderiales bacterium]|nr:molybdopterin oxidoreductase family protein [Burkholderiales bacterium]
MASQRDVALGRIVRGACPHDCPDTCALEYRVADGRLVEVRGARDHSVTDGTLCTKVARYPLRLYHRERVLYPLRRIGPKGVQTPRWQRVTWEEALADIARRLRVILRDHGAESILPYSYAGNMGLIQNASLDRRFFHALGASRLDRTICSSAGSAGLAVTLGSRLGMDIEGFSAAKLIIFWGANPITSNLHLWSRCQEAKRRGATLIAIDPYCSLTAKHCHEWLPIRPGTDAALALGLMHVLVREDLLDRDYIARYTLGFEALRERLATWPPERAAAVCGVPAATIEALARRYGATRASAIRLNYGLQRHGGGAMAVRTIACLPALTGAWRSGAGGLLLSTSGAYPVRTDYLERPDLMPRGSHGGLPRIVNMSALGDALSPEGVPATALTGEGSRTPIYALFVYNSNPAAVAPEAQKVLAGLRREDLLTVVHEHFITDTARYADYVLPATMQPEHEDIHRSYGHYDVLLNRQALPAPGECVPNTEFFRRLAHALDLTDPALFESDRSLIEHALDWQHPSLAHTSFAELWERGHVRLNLPRADGFIAPFAAGGFGTASGKCEFYSPMLAARGLDPLPNYVAPHESDDEALAARYPLALISPPERHFMNSTFANVAELSKFHEPARLKLHPRDAAARGLAAGERVRVWNDRGAITLELEITADVRPGVAVLLWGHWRDQAGVEGHVNDLTSQALTDWGGGATFYDCRVEVARA